jgi:hypothetical protein
MLGLTSVIELVFEEENPIKKGVLAVKKGDEKDG